MLASSYSDLNLQMLNECVCLNRLEAGVNPTCGNISIDNVNPTINLQKPLELL